MSTPAEKKSRTPRLDERLRERFQQDPSAFAQRTYLNLLLGIFLLVLAGLLVYFAVKVVRLAYGGDALLLLVTTIVLAVICILHEADWRLALLRTGGSPAPKPVAPSGKSG